MWTVSVMTTEGAHATFLKCAAQASCEGGVQCTSYIGAGSRNPPQFLLDFHHEGSDLGASFSSGNFKEKLEMRNENNENQEVKKLRKETLKKINMLSTLTKNQKGFQGPFRSHDSVTPFHFRF